jgi:Holliday junction resolvasome RuvABC endonuclease subunit
MTKTTGSNPSKAEAKAKRAKGKFYKPLYIIAFDPGTEITGWACFPADAAELVYEENTWFGTINPPAGAQMEVRCRAIYNAVVHKVHDAMTEMPGPSYTPVLVMEQARRGHFASVYTALKCAQVAIICGAQSARPDLPIRYVSPVQIRKALNLDPKAGKEDLRSRVGDVVKKRDQGDRRLYHMDVRDVTQDAIDAVAIGLAMARGYMVESKKIGRLY